MPETGREIQMQELQNPGPLFVDAENRKVQISLYVAILFVMGVPIARVRYTDPGSCRRRQGPWQVGQMGICTFFGNACMMDSTWTLNRNAGTTGARLFAGGFFCRHIHCGKTRFQNACFCLSGSSGRYTKYAPVTCKSQTFLKVFSRAAGPSHAWGDAARFLFLFCTAPTWA